MNRLEKLRMLQSRRKNRTVLAILLFFTVCILSSQYEAGMKVFKFILYLVCIDFFLILIFFAFNQKKHYSCLDKCLSFLFAPFLWLEKVLTGNKNARVAVCTTIVLLSAILFWLFMILFMVIPSLNNQGEKLNETRCFDFVFYLILCSFPIITTNSFFANYVNYYFLQKQNIRAYYDPEIIRGVFYAAYFVLFIFSIYWRCTNVSTIVWDSIIKPAFLTYIAFDAAFHGEYIQDLDCLREIDRTMLKHF